MKLLYFDDYKLGVLKADNTVVDVSAVVQDIPHTGPGDLMNGLIARFDTYRPKLEAAAASGTGVIALATKAPTVTPGQARSPSRTSPAKAMPAGGHTMETLCPMVT
jgi:hypothetical protein